MFEIIEKFRDEDGKVDFNNEELKAAIKEYEENRSKVIEDEIAGGLKEKVNQLLAEKKEVQSKFEDAYNKLKDIETKKAEENGDYKQIAESYKSKLERFKQDKQKELEKISSINNVLKNNAIDNFTKQALKTNGVDPDLLEWVMPEFKSKADIEINEDGSFSIKAKVGEDSIDFNEYVKDTLQHDKYQRVLLAPQDTGGNSPGNSSKNFSQKVVDNPWKTGNLTEKLRIKEENPDLAARLEKEASQK